MRTEANGEARGGIGVAKNGGSGTGVTGAAGRPKVIVILLQRQVLLILHFIVCLFVSIFLSIRSRILNKYISNTSTVTSK